MGFLNDFQFELISQTSIVHYIEFQFEQELHKANKFLNLTIKEEKLYDNNSCFMTELVTACDNLLDEISNSYRKERALPDIAKGVDIREPIGETIEYCIETLENEGSLDPLELKNELAEANRLNDDDCDYYSFSDEQIKEILESAEIIRDYRINAELEEQEDILNLLKTTIKLVDNSSSSNIFRQSFINVFSIFDAYVFEYLKKFSYSNPKELEKILDVKNNEKVKITLDEMLDFNNIEELKFNMIQKQFTGKYLSELIGKLKKYKPEIFDDIEYPELMEMIERRNIHLHNKGFVDDKYCDSFNIYRLNKGDYAYIDSNYLFIKVFNTLSQFVTNIETALPTDEDN